MALRGRAIGYRGGGIVAPEVTEPDDGGDAPSLPEGAIAAAWPQDNFYYFGGSERTLSDMFTEDENIGSWDPAGIVAGVGIRSIGNTAYNPTLTPDAFASLPKPGTGGLRVVAEFSYTGISGFFTAQFVKSPDWTENVTAQAVLQDVGLQNVSPPGATGSLAAVGAGDHELDVTFGDDGLTVIHNGGTPIVVGFMPDPLTSTVLSFSISAWDGGEESIAILKRLTFYPVA